MREMRLSGVDVQRGEAEASIEWASGIGAPVVEGGAVERLHDGRATTARAAQTPELEGRPRRADAERTVLVLASRFPPVASVGAIRVRKFVRYVCRFGWKPVVITGAQRQGEVSSHDVRRAADLDSLSDLPDGLAVHRLGPVVDHWPGYVARYCAMRLARVTRRLGLDGRWWTGALEWRFQRLHDRFAFPDRGIWRLPAVVKLALSLHRQYRFDAIFSSGMPFSDHMVGLALQSILRRPWLVDFRDPWVEYIHWRQWQTDWGRRLVRAAEAAVVRRASCVISVNDYMTRRFVSRYADAPARKFLTIQNGFDAADFPAGCVEAPRNQFCLLYAGSLYKTRSPCTVLDGFRRFLDEVPGSRQHTRFDFAGRPGPHVDELKRPSDNGTLQYVGMLSHAAAMRAMVSADVNVIILPRVPGGENDTTTKVYECLGSGKAVLAVVPLEGAAACVLRRFGGVWLCDPEDVEGIARALRDLYGRWLAGTLKASRSAESLREYTREYQAGQLAACLDSVVSTRAGCPCHKARRGSL
ncbi:MAG: glycosyltransferase [Phycisphaerae bacterium]|nr:glycosyltransferase [Phycisphaerae bacterium]